MNLLEARAVLAGALTQATRMGVPVSVAVTDVAGHLLTFERQPGAYPASIQLAQDKAYTAAMFTMRTDILAKQTQPGGPLFGVHNSLSGRVIIFGGGIPLVARSQVVGAVGVSGGQVQEDIVIAEAGARALAGGQWGLSP